MRDNDVVPLASNNAAVRKLGTELEHMVFVAIHTRDADCVITTVCSWQMKNRQMQC